LKETADESTLSKVNFNIAEALAFLHKLGFSEESEFLKHAADYYFRCGTVVALEKLLITIRKILSNCTIKPIMKEVLCARYFRPLNKELRQAY
jgi:hypothetical protein